MSAFAAVMTGKATGAISTIQLLGDSSRDILLEIFKPTGSKPATFKTGKILLGIINDGTKTIDQVTIGCEGPNSFAINCHGNPLIVEMIMELLQREGAILVTAEELLKKNLLEHKPPSTIAVEANLAQLRARTLEGTKILVNQVNTGLSEKAAEWLRNIQTISLDRIRADATQILNSSQTAKLIIFGCRAVLAGPPNTGKSTLLNCLAGRQKAIVTDIKGTTRDWVSAECQVPPLCIELIDTAGLEEQLAAGYENTIKVIAQRKSLEVVQEADLILLVLDGSEFEDQLNKRLIENIHRKRILTVLNKCDLPVRFDTKSLTQTLRDIVRISAKFSTGIEHLTEKVLQILGAVDFDLETPVVFTDRQENLLAQLKNAQSKQQATRLITELLKGIVAV